MILEIREWEKGHLADAVADMARIGSIYATISRGRGAKREVNLLPRPMTKYTAGYMLGHWAGKKAWQTLMRTKR